MGIECLERGRAVVVYRTASDPPIWYKQKRGLAVNATQEQWRPVVGYEGHYEVSDHGRVRSLDRFVDTASGRRQYVAGRVIQPWTANRGGHTAVKLSRFGQKRAALMHVLVLEAFVGPRPTGMDGCHNDGNPRNNHLSNLRWANRSGNMYDAVRHGTHNHARKTHCKRGHEFTPSNTRIHTLPNGSLRRFCRPCKLESERKRREAKRAQRPDYWQPRKSGRRPKPYCGRGHEFTPENTYLRRNGRRSCRRCQALRDRKYQSQKQRGTSS